MIRGLIEKANRVASDPAAFLERINRGLHNLLGETVMKLPTTASYTVIDFIDGKATIASAEADFPIILNQACDGVIEINEDEVSTGCALGSHLECEYSNHSLDLDKIGMFLFSTDGAVSRTNIEGEEIGRELLQDLTIRYSDVDEPCAQLGIEILEWGSGHKLEDDGCLISVRSKK
jgi:serine phosphatase RsbU (regulator of sigma subunit)